MQVFAEQGSSASQMTAAKIMHVIARLPGCGGQAADAVSAYTQVKWRVLPDCSKFLNRNVQMFGYVFHDTNGQNHGKRLTLPWYFLNETCTVIHWPDCCGKENSKRFMRTWMGENSELGIYVRSSENKAYVCQCTWMTSKW